MEAQVIEFKRNDKIDTSELVKNTRKIRDGLISPAKEYVEDEVVKDHAAEPIKKLEDIVRISKFLISQGRYRDNMLFIVGINFGLRVSDLRVLRFSNLINSNFTFKDTFPVFEKKTRNTRKRKKNRYITINQAVIEAVTLYLEHTDNVCLSDYMFYSNLGRPTDGPLHRNTIDQMLKKIAVDLDLNIHMSTHTLRKTFAYHQLAMSNNDPRKLMLLQKMLNHSTVAQTLDYIGITSDEIEQAYRELNLGSEKYNYLANSNIIEFESKVI